MSAKKKRATRVESRAAMRATETVVGYGYVGEWSDGTIGWWLPRHVSGYAGQTEPPNEDSIIHSGTADAGDPFYLCRITVERLARSDGRAVTRRIREAAK